MPNFLFLGLNVFFMFKNDVQMPVVFDWRMLGVFSFQAVFVGFFLSLFCLSPVFAQPGYTISQPAWTNAPAITGGTNITFTSQNDAVATVITLPFYFDIMEIIIIHYTLTPMAGWPLLLRFWLRRTPMQIL